MERNGEIGGLSQIQKRNTFTLMLKTKDDDYEIYLDEIIDSAEMLDWIFQLRAKAWVTNDILGDMLLAFKDLFHPQATMCSGGVGKTIEPKSVLKKAVSA